MRPGKDDMGGHGSDDMRRVADVGCAGIALPAVVLDGGALGDVAANEGVQGFGRAVGDRRQTNAARCSAFDLDGAGNQHPALVAASWPPAGGSSFLVVSSTSTTPCSGERSGATMARR